MDSREALGASEVSTSRIAIYVPAADSEGRAIDQDRWVDEAARLLSRLFGGASAHEVSGFWLNEATGALIKEPSQLVYSFAEPAKLKAALPEVRAFLHRMGRETNQGEVGVEIDGGFHRIMTFDRP